MAVALVEGGAGSGGTRVRASWEPEFLLYSALSDGLQYAGAGALRVSHSKCLHSKCHSL